MKTAIEKPEHWEVTPDESYGIGKDGMHYYRINQDVYRTLNGYTSYVCSQIAWQNPQKRKWFMES